MGVPMSDLLAPIIGRYANFAMTSDAIPEINALTYMGFEAAYPDLAPDGRLALVLIEPRLIDTSGDPNLRGALMQRLQRLKGDLRAEGLQSRFLLADLYRGPVHKDGRIVLALRRLFKEVKASFANFEGVLLIGNFPESSLVRRVSWVPGGRLAVMTELVSSRAEIVLSDLTGNWEALYRQGDFDAEAISAEPDAATAAAGWCDGGSVRNCDFSSTNGTVMRSGRFRDAFYIDDAIYTILEDTAVPRRLRIRLYQAERNNEVAPDDRSLTNILARPDIAVARINALHVAVNPNPALIGTDGRRFIDAAGNPQTVASPAPLFHIASQYVSLFTHRDFDLERTLLVRYLDRNHRFRVGAFSNHPFRGAVISGTIQFSPDGYEGLVNAAAADFGPCVKVANADLRQYVQFHKTPATIKCIVAHSDARRSDFRDGYDADGMTADIGGPPLRWLHRSGQHVPTFEGMGGGADLVVHRAMWQHGTLRDAGASLVIHSGCDVNSVDETQGSNYVTSHYAHWNNAEGLLFFTNCIALFSRAKTFNDSPNGFADGFRLFDRANFGSCLKSYYNAQGNDGGLSTNNIQRKRAYFWSINGDWTLRLRNRNGLGVLAADGGLRSVEVQPNRAWIDGWNFDAALNRVRGVGDLDGDGVDEMIMTSEWGIGVVKFDGTNFRALMTAPRDTWFGGWRYDATVNPGRDIVMDVQNFTGTGKSEVLLWSAWGITTLALAGASLSPTRLHANGTRLGGWVFDTGDNRYCGSGQFDADGRRDIVLMSPWGLGIISLEAGAHLFMAANDSLLGGWRLGTATNTIRLIADLDGDGRDEILITSAWGIGVLKLVNGALTHGAIHANGDNIDGHIIRNTNNFVAADNFRGGAQRQLLVADPAGLHVLGLAGGRLCRLAFVANGTRVDGWLLDTTNNQFQAAGDVNADGRAEWVVRSAWGIGVMGLDAGGKVRTYTKAAYGAVIGDWYLQGGDQIVARGNIAGPTGRRELVIVKP